MWGVTVTVVPAVAYPAKLVVETVWEAFTLEKGAAATLAKLPVALSFIRIFGAARMLARALVAKACTTTFSESGLIRIPLNP